MDHCDRHLITSVQELGSHPGGYGVLILVRSIDRDESMIQISDTMGNQLKLKNQLDQQSFFAQNSSLVLSLEVMTANGFFVL